MALYSVTAGNTALAADVNQYKSVLEGSATSTWLVKAASTTHFQVQLADNAGSYSFKILDSDGVAIATIDSNGNLTLSGSFAPSTLVLPLAASPAQTTEGSVVWDSDDDVLTIGDGSSRKTFYPGAVQYKYKTATQSFTSTTTLADVTATSGNLALTLPANTTQLVDVSITISSRGANGSSGLKFGLTFTNSPTTARIIEGTYPSYAVAASDGAINTSAPMDQYVAAAAITTGTAFLGVSAWAATAGTAGLVEGILRYRFLFVVGGTASVVTVQLAQNASNATATQISSAFMTSQQMIAG